MKGDGNRIHDSFHRGKEKSPENSPPFARIDVLNRGLDDTADEVAGRSHVGASHIRIVWSSEADANTASSTGFQATALTHPALCPSKISNESPVSRCHT